jgi:hypothetical protein
MAVRKDWATLAGIIQKALDSIPETERNDIYKKWLPVRYEHGFNYTLFWQVMVVCAVIMPGMGGRELANQLEKIRPDINPLHVRIH